MDFCKCGSIFINDKCTNQRCPSKSQKSKNWVIDGRGMDFTKPLSYEEAAGQAKRLNKKDTNKQ